MRNYALLLERRQPGDLRTRDQQVDIVRTLIGHHAFQVHHVAHDRVLIGDTHAAKDLACLPGHGEGQMHIVALGHADLGGGGAPFIAQYAQAPSEQLCLGDLGDHFGEFLLGELELAYGPAELDAFLAVAKCRVITLHGHAKRAPCYTVPGAIQATQWRTQAALVGQQILLGHLHIVEHQFACGAGS